MMADSLFNGSDFNDSVDYDAVRPGSPTLDDHFNEQDTSRGYRYRFGSARTSVVRSHGIGSDTAAPVLLRGPRLADTAPADLDTVNFITSSYADFFQDALQAADLRRGHHKSESGDREEEFYSDGDGYLRNDEDSQNNSDYEKNDDSNDSHDDEGRQDLDNTIDSLELDPPSRSSETTKRTSQTSQPSASSATNANANSIAARATASNKSDSYVPYVDSAIPDGSMTLSEAMQELEHLRRTNHSLVESLSEEKQRRSELENKLSGVQVIILNFVRVLRCFHISPLPLKAFVVRTVSFLI